MIKALVVDGDLAEITRLRGIMESRGCQVWGAESGDQAYSYQPRKHKSYIGRYPNAFTRLGQHGEKHD